MILNKVLISLILGLALAMAAAVSAGAQNRPFSSGANPNTNPNASLKSCLDHYDGMNVAARTRCFEQHCKGRWGQGDCPTGTDMSMTQGSDARTPLGQCLREAGANPFKRDRCGWRHCNNNWDTPECAALHPKKNNSNLLN